MLLAFTLLAVVFYVCFVRPTVLAKRFVAAVESRQFEYADSLMGQGRNFFVANADSDSQLVAVHIFPRSWSDVWRFRRRVSVSVSAQGRVTGLAEHLGMAAAWGSVADLVCEFGPLGPRVIRVFPPASVASPL